MCLLNIRLTYTKGWTSYVKPCNKQECAKYYERNAAKTNEHLEAIMKCFNSRCFIGDEAEAIVKNPEFELNQNSFRDYWIESEIHEYQINANMMKILYIVERILYQANKILFKIP